MTLLAFGVCMLGVGWAARWVAQFTEQVADGFEAVDRRHARRTEEVLRAYRQLYPELAADVPETRG